MNGKFVAFAGTVPDLTLVLEEGKEWLIGRDSDQATLIIPDPHVSRLAAKASIDEEGHILLENLSATNPIFVNGQELKDPQVLNEGDSIEIGNTSFHFTLKETEETEEELFTPPEEPAVDLEMKGRWLLKVVAGPNTGAELHLQPDRSYLLGTDGGSCDIVFHDLSVSRQHARLQVHSDETLEIEDLHSRNKVIIDGNPIEERATLRASALVQLGTTGFVMIDQEQPSETIFATAPPTEEPTPPPPEPVEEKRKPILAGGPLLLLLIAIGIIVIAVTGTLTLFKGEDIVYDKPNYELIIQKALEPFPSVRYTFNTTTGKLFLLGHVLTPVDRSELFYNLDSLNFIQSIDDNVIVDQYVWKEFNTLLNSRAEWMGVSIHSPSPGIFVVNGYLKTQEQAQSLEDYLHRKFPYLDKLENKVIVEENLIDNVKAKLHSHGLRDVSVKVSNGDLILSGKAGQNQVAPLNEVIAEAKKLRGIRSVKNFVTIISASKAFVDLTGKYRVEGSVTQDHQIINILINGKVVRQGDVFDGYKVEVINPQVIILEKDGVKYKIDYNQ